MSILDAIGVIAAAFALIASIVAVALGLARL